ncbi:DUF5695 domain-containing protein [Fulvivirga maritima]|uniref:DUF5695 domain-containing protein n=1 Tax=Fulvivirga maritima TaxID=2904247 RepID=UPI001F427480|nr:DUF5695 domain-containing protein [Fulvivirga maritima]UII26184.1 DUF5695 domain-containing protein [Fulvivirga maritima]
MKLSVSATFGVLSLFVYFSIKAQSPIAAELNNQSISGTVTMRGMPTLIDPDDSYEANVVGRSDWGRVNLMYRVPGGEWLSINKYNTTFEATDSTATIIDNQPGMPVVMEQHFSLQPNAIDMDVTVKAAMQFPIEIGDLSIKLPWKLPAGGGQVEVFERGFTKHHFISGHGSFIYFTRPSGKGPFLMVLPKKGTKFEYYESHEGNYEVFIHSLKSASEIEGGTWRQPHTSIHLDSAKRESREVHYGVKFRWAKNWDDMRQVLYDEGLFDIRLVPGMSVPTGMEVLFSLRTKNKIDKLQAEFPEQTSIEYVRETKKGHHIYKAIFKKLGENLITVHYNGDHYMNLEFFVTEPLETLYKKRSDFIVHSQQHRDSSKWYNGLYSVYDMKHGVLRGPDNTDGFDGWWGYVLASDDPGLCKAPYVAAKNVYYPNEEEIASVEYYLENYVWDKLQRTDKDDPYPYGIYGVPNWKVARDPLARAGTRSRQLDRMQIWRSYDYPHIVMLYYHMYQVAKLYPEKVHYLDAEGYLERACQTAKAYFTYPYEIFGEYYETYKQGCYNELVIENLIAYLEEEGRQKDADWLRNEYEKKVKYFIYDDPYPYGSEYSFDRTAFESSYAFAKYGFTHDMQSDERLWYDKTAEKWMSHPEVNKKAARDFMDRQHYANLSVRGWLEAKYFLLGSDFNGSSDHHALSYMARMGGWSVLDYGIHFSEQPSDWLQLGYASYLSPWSLMNTGTEASNYGFWFPGKENDGAMGWAFTSVKRGPSWIRKEMDRGPWYYDGEADLGNGAAFRMAATILTEDPLFGWIAYGGQLDRKKKAFHIIPQDGLRAQFAVVTDQERIQLRLETDGFAKNQPITVSKDQKEISFEIENRSGTDHTNRLYIENYQNLKFKCLVNGAEVKINKGKEGSYYANIEMRDQSPQVTIIIQH